MAAIIIVLIIVIALPILILSEFTKYPVLHWKAFFMVFGCLLGLAIGAIPACFIINRCTSGSNKKTKTHEGKILALPGEYLRPRVETLTNNPVVVHHEYEIAGCPVYPCDGDHAPAEEVEPNPLMWRIEEEVDVSTAADHGEAHYSNAVELRLHFRPQAEETKLDPRPGASHETDSIDAGEKPLVYVPSNIHYDDIALETRRTPSQLESYC